MTKHGVTTYHQLTINPSARSVQIVCTYMYSVLTDHYHQVQTGHSMSILIQTSNYFILNFFCRLSIITSRVSKKPIEHGRYSIEDINLYRSIAFRCARVPDLFTVLVQVPSMASYSQRTGLVHSFIQRLDRRGQLSLWLRMVFTSGLPCDFSTPLLLVRFNSSEVALVDLPCFVLFFRKTTCHPCVRERSFYDKFCACEETTIGPDLETQQ